MLSEKEISWLEGRKVLCPRCDHYRAHIEGSGTCHRGDKGKWMQAECRWFQRADLVPDYKDAAEFEGVVAMLLANPHPFRFREITALNPERLPICRLCKKTGLAKLDAEGNCKRTQNECRRMRSMMCAERCLESGDIPSAKELEFEEPRLERSITEEEQAK